MRINPQVLQIDAQLGYGYVALYLIRGEQTAIIDTGVTDSPRDYIAPALRQHGLRLEDIDLILNTHSHPDHTGGNLAIQKASNANIIIHTDEINGIKNHENSFREQIEPAIKAIMGASHIKEEKRRFMEMAGPDQVNVSPLKDNDVIDLGGGCSLRVIHLPGHSNGSVGFYWDKEGILFSGDSLPGLHHKDGGLPIIHNMTPFLISLQRIHQLSPNLILHSHEFRGIRLPASTAKRNEEIKQFIGDSQEITDRLIEAISKIAPNVSGLPFAKIYNQVLALLPGEIGYKPIGQHKIELFSQMTVFNRLRELNAFS
jgi:glyoxylase-like metal-dependent hydrolase (beta-lactamase superfamily II)